MTEKQTGSRQSSVAAIVSRLKQAYGEDWSFDIVSHNLLDRPVEIVGELRAHGMSAREPASAAGRGSGRPGGVCGRMVPDGDQMPGRSGRFRRG